MSNLSSISATACLIADPTRVAMLMALMDGRSLPAGELARASGVTPQTASSHLAKLLEGGLITVDSAGRHRYYSLADRHIAETLAHLAMIQPVRPTRPKMRSPQHSPLRFCRSCYGHLAGQVGVELTRALQNRGYIQPSADKQFIVTAAGVQWFGGIGMDVAAIRPTRRGLAHQCLDWTERVYHLAGPLGDRLLATLCTNDWLRRSSTSRTITVTRKGWTQLDRTLGVTQEQVEQTAAHMVRYS